MDAPLGQARPATRPLDWLLDRPAYGALAFALAQVVAWTLAPALSHSAPPLDVVESYLWGREWVIGTFKHPGMPSWILEVSRLATGAVGWPAYLATQIVVALTYLLVFMLGRDMMGTPRALAGTLLLAGVFYFQWPTIELNHNVVQMPYWAGIAWLLWRVRQRPRMVWWALLGLLAGQSLYAKLSSALLIGVAGLWLLLDRPLRRQLATPGPWLGLAVFAAMATPLVLWLARWHFGPLLYAAERGAHSGEGVLQFAGAQLLAGAGVPVLLWLAGLLGKDPRSAAGPPLPAPPLDPAAIPYLAYMTGAPLAFTSLAALVMGSGLKSMWGAPMLGLVGLLAVALTSARFGRPALERLARAAMVLLVVLPLGYVADTLLEARFTGRPKRQNWPQAEIARHFDEVWAGATGGRRLGIVAGERWVAGIVALRPEAMPSILTDGSLELSPWVTPERLRSEGALVVWEIKHDGDPPPPGLEPLIGGRATAVARFPWPAFPSASPLLIGYAIVPPA